MTCPCPCEPLPGAAYGWQRPSIGLLFEDAVDKVFEDLPEVPGPEGSDRPPSLGLTDGVGYGNRFREQFSGDGWDTFGFEGENVFDHGPRMLLGLPGRVRAQLAGFKPGLCCSEPAVHVRGKTVVHILNRHGSLPDRKSVSIQRWS